LVAKDNEDVKLCRKYNMWKTSGDW